LSPVDETVRKINIEEGMNGDEKKFTECYLSQKTTEVAKKLRPQAYEMLIYKNRKTISKGKIYPRECKASMTYKQV